MARPKFQPRAGKGAKARILTKMIYPRRPWQAGQQSIVVLQAEEQITINRKLQQCYTFRVEEDGGNGALCHAIKRYVHVTEEGDAADLFDPSLPGPDDPMFQKPKKKVKWRKSESKESCCFRITVDDFHAEATPIKM